MLTQKIITLSDEQFHESNFNLLTQTLLKNGYPPNMINSNIRKVLHKKRVVVPQNIPPESQNSAVAYTSIPYVRGLFEKIRKLMNNYDIKCVGRSNAALSESVFTKLKDKIPIHERSHVVYQLVCECGSKYIGQTKQTLGKRICQHKRDSNRTTTDNNISAISKHLKESMHEVDENSTKIIDTQIYYRKRVISEMISIKKCTNSLNKQTDSAYLQNTYDNLITKNI